MRGAARRRWIVIRICTGSTPKKTRRRSPIDQVRDVIEIFTLTAHRGGAKVVIVEPAEAMTTAAANALLKTLEEPSPRELSAAAEPSAGPTAGDGPQPLPARSRCARRTPRAVARLARRRAGRRAPRRSAPSARRRSSSPRRSRKTILSIFNKLESDLVRISEDRLDPQAVAQSVGERRYGARVELAAAPAPRGAAVAARDRGGLDRGHSTGRRDVA